MAIAVVTKATGGLPVIDVTATKPGLGVPVTEATHGRGIAVTKVSLAVGGLPVTFVADSNYWPPADGGTTYATFDGTPALSAVVSNGNLTITQGAALSNAGVKSTSAKTSGKLYFEMTVQVSSSGSTYFGVTSGTLADMGNNLNSTEVLIGVSTFIYSNDVTTGKNLGTTAVNDVFGFAIDLTARLAWIRRNAGTWNADGTANPATGVGGVVVEAGSFAPAVRFSNSTPVNAAVTGNFGQSAFTQTVPAGFTSGWPV